MELSNEILESLDEEMREKVAACETPEDLMELAMASGVDLTEEQLKMVAGGSDDDDSFWNTDGFSCYI